MGDRPACTEPLLGACCGGCARWRESARRGGGCHMLKCGGHHGVWALGAGIEEGSVLWGF